MQVGDRQYSVGSEPVADVSLPEVVASSVSASPADPKVQPPSDSNTPNAIAGAEDPPVGAGLLDDAHDHADVGPALAEAIEAEDDAHRVELGAV